MKSYRPAEARGTDSTAGVFTVALIELDSMEVALRVRAARSCTACGTTPSMITPATLSEIASNIGSGPRSTPAA